MLIKLYFRYLQALLVGLCFFFPNSVISANNKLSCIVKTNTGLHTFEITPGFGIKVHNSSVELKLNDTAILKVPYDNFLSIYYKTDENTNVPAIISEQITNISIKNRNLDVTCYLDNQRIKIFDINGDILLNEMLSPNHAYSFDLSEFSSGIYIIKVGDQSYKILLQK